MDFKTVEGRRKFLKSIKSITITSSACDVLTTNRQLNIPMQVTKVINDRQVEAHYGNITCYFTIFTAKGELDSNTFRTTEMELVEENEPGKIINSIRDMIDVALDFGDKERFMELTDMLKQIAEKGRQLA